MRHKEIAMIAKKDTGRKLNLSKETLRQLSSADLRRAAGGLGTTATINTLCILTNVLCHQAPKL